MIFEGWGIHVARPSDWHVLELTADPVPGDCWRVEDLGGRMRTLGDAAADAARDVRGLVGDKAAMNWIGAAGDAFKEAIGKFPGQLDQVADSHHQCAAALTAYAGTLDGAQAQADRARAQAVPLFARVQALHGQLASANAANTTAANGLHSVTGNGATAPDPTALAAATRAATTAQHAVATLNTQLSGPEAQLAALRTLAHQAAGLRDTAENTAATKIQAASDAGIPPDSFWHRLGDVCATVWHGLITIAKIVSFLGALVLLIVGGPLWLIIAVVVAGLLILADTLYEYSQGKATLLDVGLAALSCIPITKGLTSLNAIREAFTAGGALGAGLHIGGALLGAAKDMVTGMVALLKGGGGLLRNSVDFLSEVGRGAGDLRIPTPTDVMAAVKAFGPKIVQEAHYTAEQGHYYATRILEGGRADGQTVLAGHGVYDSADGVFKVPGGTSIAFYCEHGTTIPGISGLAVEAGVYPGGSEAVHIFGPGEEIPNYTLKAPSASGGGSFTVFENSTTVVDPTKLMDIIQPGSGLIHWAACREIIR